MYYRVAADVLVVIHAGIAMFIVLGLAAILIGAVRRWQWVRNVWFRLLHAGAILFVVAESWLAIDCPLTLWEKALRKKAGDTPYRGDFIGHLVHEALFFEFKPWVFTVVYSVFGALVVAVFVFVPPRLRRRSVKAE